MKSWMRISVITTALLGAMAPAAWAQSAAVGEGMGSGMMVHNPERMRERMAERHTQRLAELKTKLRLDASQEAAWKSYTDAVQQAYSGSWPDRNAMAKLSTPERIDQMQAWHQRMDSEMQKRGNATKSFYAVLNSEQKKVFDAETLRMMPGGDDKRMQRHSH